MTTPLKVLATGFAALLATAHFASAEIYITDPSREAILHRVFGGDVDKGLHGLFQERYSDAYERALELAQEVEDHQLTATQARAQLLTALQRMDRGQSLGDLPDPAFEVVGEMPHGESLGERK